MNCPYCNQPAQWVPNEEVYGKRYGKFYMCWFCKPCRAYVGCHNNTKIPLGTMANVELRGWRVKVHNYIDPLWKGGKISRKKVYQILKDRFGKDIHIGESDIETCKRILEFKVVVKEAEK